MAAIGEIDENTIVIRTDIPYRARKNPRDAKSLQVGLAIHKAIEEQSPATIKQIARKTGQPVERVINHVTHYLKLKKPQLAIRNLPGK